LLVNQRLAAVGVLMMLVALLALLACGDAAAPEPQVVEVEVTKVVTETVVETREVPVEVTKIVTETTETVVETRDVPVEVTKIVTETVVETRDVQDRHRNHHGN
jgi:ABC-type Fe3+-hydroxamate transport system substrate-binding protein